MLLVKYAVYDCQVCGALHEMKIELILESKEDLKFDYKKILDQDGITEEFIEICLRELIEAHGIAEIYNPERLGFSLTEELTLERSKKC